jgi:hypothetical protein
VKNRSQFVLLIIIALVCIPVIASSESTANTTLNVTSIPTVTQSLVNTTTMPATVATTSTPANNTTTTTAVPTANVTAVPVTTSVPVQNITVATTTPAAVNQSSTGNITAASSPPGASVLIDGVFYGVTPGDFNGIAGGNHIVRLTLSGYYDYEGTIYVVPGQVTHVFGTLPPLTGQVLSTASTPVPTTAPTVQPTATPSTDVLANPTVIAAILGIITASIGAAITIFTHFAKLKKE